MMNRSPDAKHEVFQTRDLSAALVALMNLIFAYGRRHSRLVIKRVNPALMVTS